MLAAPTGMSTSKTRLYEKDVVALRSLPEYSSAVVPACAVPVPGMLSMPVSAQQ